MVSEITIADNIADDSGGGVYLFRVNLTVSTNVPFQEIQE